MARRCGGLPAVRRHRRGRRGQGGARDRARSGGLPARGFCGVRDCACDRAELGLVRALGGRPARSQRSCGRRRAGPVEPRPRGYGALPQGGAAEGKPSGCERAEHRDRGRGTSAHGQRRARDGTRGAPHRFAELGRADGPLERSDRTDPVEEAGALRRDHPRGRAPVPSGGRGVVPPGPIRLRQDQRPADRSGLRPAEPGQRACGGPDREHRRPHPDAARGARPGGGVPGPGAVAPPQPCPASSPSYWNPGESPARSEPSVSKRC